MAETMFHLNSTGPLKLTTPSFGFTGWNGKPIYDEFQVWLWETRKAAGIEEPYPEPIGYEPTILTSNRSGSYTSQILFSGTITVKVTNGITSHVQTYGIAS